MNQKLMDQGLGRREKSGRRTAMGRLAALVMALMVAMWANFDSQRGKAEPGDQTLARITAEGNGQKHQDDPCERLPEARGRAEGHDRKCRGGSSSGVSRGDFNGDGFADLAVGAPGKDSPASVASSGAVYVIYGSATGLLPEGGNGIPATQFWSQDTDGVPDTSEAGDGFGSALAAGEFNGDAYSDLAIGVDGEDNLVGGEDNGLVVVIYGSPNGLTTTDASVPSPRRFIPTDLDINTSNDIALFINDAFFGSALAWGDFDGDDFGDLAVGAPGAFIDRESDVGAVLIVFGSGDGLTSARSQVIPQNFILNQLPRRNTDFGEVLAAGDFNGDGRADLAIAAPRSDAFNVNDSGVVHVIFGTDDGLNRAGNLFFTDDRGRDIPEEDAEFGSALAAGDFDRDGRADLAIGAHKASVGGIDSAGMVLVRSSAGVNGTLGARQILTQNQFFTGGSESFDRFGFALAAGDFNGDGFVDLAIGVPFEDVAAANGQTVINGGEVNVVRGSGTGLVIGAGQAQRFIQGAGGVLGTLEEDDQFGTSLSAWNFGRNQTLRDSTGQPFIFRTADLAIGVPFEDLFTEDGTVLVNSGAIGVLYGGLGGLTSNNDQLLFQSNIGGFTNEAFDRFGRFLY